MTRSGYTWRDETPSDSRRVEEGRGTECKKHPARFPSPLIKPDVPISSIRLSDRFHQSAHGRLAESTSRRRKTPIFPNTTLSENLEVPSDGTLWRRLMKCLTP